MRATASSSRSWAARAAFSNATFVFACTSFSDWAALRFTSLNAFSAVALSFSVSFRASASRSSIPRRQAVASFAVPLSSALATDLRHFSATSVLALAIAARAQASAAFSASLNFSSKAYSTRESSALTAKQATSAALCLSVDLCQSRAHFFVRMSFSWTAACTARFSCLINSRAAVPATSAAWMA